MRGGDRGECSVDEITLIHGDCLEEMKIIPTKSIDLVLTDPPYGIGADLAAHESKGKHGWKDYGYTNWDKKLPKKYFDEMFRVSKNQVIWGGKLFHRLFVSFYGVVCMG